MCNCELSSEPSSGPDVCPNCGHMWHGLECSGTWCTCKGSHITQIEKAN